MTTHSSTHAALGSLHKQNASAFLFPGQGSQSVGMLLELSKNFQEIIKTYHHASEVLGYDLWRLVQEGPDTLLNQTEKTQPALLAAGVALFRVWQTKQVEMPIFMAGHSLGEYTALVCADSLDYAEAISLVALRGELMQQAVPEGKGGMAAIVGLTDAQILQICEQAAQGNVLSPANFNAIGQTVLAGEISAIERAIVLAKKAEAKIAKQIPVSVPSHCVLMKPAADRLAQHIKKIAFQNPKIPVIHNVDVVSYEDTDSIRSALVRQLYHPVRWVETIQTLAKQGVSRFVECGPGKVLAGLNKRIVPDLPIFSISSLESLEQALEKVSI